MLTFIYSTVNAGKTATLLMRAHSCEERGVTYAIFVPEVASKRDGKAKVASRIGFEREAIPLSDNDCPYEHLRDGESLPSCVFVDEAQFLNRKQIMSLAMIADRLEVPVYAFGLRTDFKGEPFEGSKYLLAWADRIEEVATFATGGIHATFNMKIDSDGSRVDDGESISVGFGYEPVSRLTFFAGGER